MQPRSNAGPHTLFLTLFLTLLLALCPPAIAQSSCSSDGQPVLRAVQDRFINADCEACWAEAPSVATRAESIPLDWILPGMRGDDAPLSAAARQEGLERQQALKHASQSAAPAPELTPALRVARGPVLSGYVGTSIALQPSGAGPLTAWLVLVESIPAGQDGTPIARNLVRNALVLDWNASTSLQELRAMSVPEGAKPERLHVVGWVEDAAGRTLAAVQSHCEAETE